MRLLTNRTAAILFVLLGCTVQVLRAMEGKGRVTTPFSSSSATEERTKKLSELTDKLAELDLEAKELAERES